MMQIQKLSQEGDSLRRSGEYAASIEVYNRLLPMLDSVQYFDLAKQSSRADLDTLNSSYGHAFLNSGVVYRKTGRYREALVQYDRAIDVYASAGDSAMCNTARMGMAIVYQERAEYDEALDRYISAALSFEAMGDSLRLGEAYSCIGNVQESMGHLSRAEDYYRKSLAIWNSLENKDGLASIHNNLGTVSFEQQRWKSVS